MIPSSPRRTWIFLIVSSLIFFAPDLMVPEHMAHDPAYLKLYSLYQAVLLVVFFWLGPALCRVMVVREATDGPLRAALDQALADLRDSPAGLPRLPATLVDYPAPFIVTAGLVPGRSEIFLATDSAAQLGPHGLRFLLARALAHGEWAQRLTALLPILALTLLWPDDYSALSTWLFLAVFALAWLALHWAFELRADRRAARAMGAQAALGFAEVQASGAAGLGSLRPPLPWRLRAIASA
jgi:hypothetical protein